MKQKIEWYKEVLEIEPNSKIFFPLARMLAKEGRPDEAIAVLRQGVGRHPDHVEARLFLAELLYASDRIIELQQEVDVLSVLFKNYPGFWRAWGERLFDEDKTRDAGLAAIFLAAFLQNLPVSWAGVIEHGLKALVSDSPPRPSATLPEEYPLAAPSAPPMAGEDSPGAVTPEAPAPASISPRQSETAPVAEQHPEPLDDEADDEVEEPITLRTRSMAEVLAEQGDLAGALDIYNELLAAADSDAVKKDLQTRIDALSGNTAQGGEGEVQASKEEKKDWLAILAQRLEARSLQ
ncbi:MAG: tetratricopeptide repeat protein [Deltaproteobacteria bacterium]|nr:tetratricopeptide repeat protein [Deltaproteobacteria bacterium]